MAKQLELPFGNTQAKTTILGVTRSTLGLTAKAGSVLLKGIGKAVAYGHDALDLVQEGYTKKRQR